MMFGPDFSISKCGGDRLRGTKEQDSETEIAYANVEFYNIIPEDAVLDVVFRTWKSDIGI